MDPQSRVSEQQDLVVEMVGVPELSYVFFRKKSPMGTASLVRAGKSFGGPWCRSVCLSKVLKATFGASLEQ